MTLHGALLVCLVCGALGASIPAEEQPNPSEYEEKLIDYRRSLLEFNWRIDESKYNLNKDLRSLLSECKNGIPAIEEKLQSLRASYADQIAGYRASLDSLYSADLEPRLKFGEDHKAKMEENLKKAEANFENGVTQLGSALERLKLDAVKVKADGDAPETSTSWFPSWTTIYNTIASYFTNFENLQVVQNTVSSLANNVTAFFNQNQGTQVVNNAGSAGSSAAVDTAGSQNSGTPVYSSSDTPSSSDDSGSNNSHDSDNSVLNNSNNSDNSVPNNSDNSDNSIDHSGSSYPGGSDSAAPEVASYSDTSLTSDPVVPSRLRHLTYRPEAA